jgi:hypothetical protein
MPPHRALVQRAGQLSPQDEQPRPVADQH